MYFDPADVRGLVTAILDRFPGVELMFDTIPPWFSRKTLRGFHKTADYTAPPMPWGVRRGTVPALLREWSSRIAEIEIACYGPSHGPVATLTPIFDRVPVLRDIPPSIVRVRAAA
ncbi:hypothetical protein [Nocardia sp. AG03]|uniref:hypothetical protein n=1 Tax=Nocardia sp. AG03 TaxID=3025312 RepID=UPI0024183CE9|nr:hypothetical protein [Nocardia sp. AG03]